MGIRRQARELALQMLFQDEFNANFSPREMIRHFSESFSIAAEVRQYAEILITGIHEHKRAIDETIQSHSPHWKVARMALVDLNVMRIALFEMKFMTPPNPAGVAINEAVEIAKRYGSTESGAFVNGILDNIAKKI
jgi:transcription antitermination protein NusB